VGRFLTGSAGVAVVAAFGVAGLTAPAYADSTVTVQGTALPDPATANLSFVGCADLYQRTDERLAPTIGFGPGAAPSGTRSLGWDLAGGNAVGALFPVASMLNTTASLAVNATGRATGVAYAGYQEPADAGTTLLWLGRSELATPGGAWQTVDATTRVYTWAKYDMDSRQRVVREPDVQSTVADFVAAHGGDGPGLYTIGFGCDGTPFSMDQLRVGAPGAVTTNDLEGLRTVVSISRHRVDADDDADGEVTITGRLRTETGDPIPHATMILERRNPDSRVWKPVLVAEVRNGGVSATVPADERAFYRWRFVERPLAEGNASMALLLDIVPTLPTGSPSPTPSSMPSPTQSPSDPSSPSAPDSTDSTSAPASDPAGESASGAPSQAPIGAATQSPSQSATLSESATVSTASPVDASDEAAPSGSSTP
jgi:hypothetical protein